jgi:transmembrane sensor
MSETQRRIDPGLEEAADWYATLNQRTVSHEALTAFRAWRQTPSNAAAYAQVENTLGKVARLSSDPDIKAALGEVGSRRSLRDRLARLWAKGFRRPVIGIGLAVGAGAIGFLALQVYQGETFSTGIGEQRIVRLDDGSTLRLDTNSLVRVKLGGKSRNLELVRGQAQFDVSHDANRPFVVASDGVSVRALGTKFDVRRYDDGVKVTLVEGQVEVSQADAAAPARWTLRPGQQVVAGEAPQAPRNIDVASATSWTRGTLVFRDQSLASAVAEVNRYSRTKIDLRSDRLARTPVSGVFASGDTDAFVAAVTTLHPLEQSTSSDGRIVLRDRPTAAL